MIETFTSIDNLNYPQPTQENATDDSAEQLDPVFYDHIKSQLNALRKDPSDETIARILAYSKTK